MGADPSLRFCSETERLKNPEGVGHVATYDVVGPSIRELRVPCLFWYGVHAVGVL